jgi:hypothetical protein
MFHVQIAVLNPHQRLEDFLHPREVCKQLFIADLWGNDSAAVLEIERSDGDRFHIDAP